MEFSPSEKNKDKDPAVSAIALAEIATEKALKPEPRSGAMEALWQKLKGDASQGGRIAEKISVPEQAPPIIGKRTQTEFGPPHDVGRLLVEAPSVEQAQIVPFDKKADNFTTEELMTTAEKIKVQGVTLKEMVELGRLDEAGLRRVIQEFLEGGDVNAMVNREIDDKEMRYERDPHLRKAQADQDSAPAEGPVAVSVDTSGDHGTNTNTTSRVGAPLADYTGPRPVPDSAKLREVRSRQLATIGGSIIIVILIIMILILLAR